MHMFHHTCDFEVSSSSRSVLADLVKKSFVWLSRRIKNRKKKTKNEIRIINFIYKSKYYTFVKNNEYIIWGVHMYMVHMYTTQDQVVQTRIQYNTT